MHQDPNLYQPSLIHQLSSNYSNTIYTESLNMVAAAASTSSAMDTNMGVGTAISTPGNTAVNATATPPSNKSTLTAPASQRRKLSGRYVLTDFTVERTLGTGSFGRVHLAKSRHNMRFYAIKVSLRTSNTSSSHSDLLFPHFRSCEKNK
jgi:protein kinase A